MNNESATLKTSLLDTLRSRLRGTSLVRGDEGYDIARRVWNGAIDRHPSCIVGCADAEDVSHAMRIASEHGLRMTVRGGGHNVAGRSIRDGSLLLDLSKLRQVAVNRESRVATVQGGAVWRDVDSATAIEGLATTGGLISSTGVGGFTLGGGAGWLMRKHGLACDNLRSAEVVTADGQILTASATENPDLFWGLRGGGGNFGVVTAFELDLHPVGPTVAAGPIFYPGDRAEEIMRFYRDFARDLPDELSTLVNLITAPPAPFLPEDWHGKKLIALVGCYSGDPEEGMKVLQPIRDLGDPVADLVGPMPYVQMQSLLDALWPKGTQAYMKAGNKELAIQNYEKSLQLDPKNTNAVDMLKKLKEQK